MDKKQLAAAIQAGKIEWSVHALRRMLQRGITRKCVKAVICSGEIIEDHPEDQPFPSALFFGRWKDDVLHVVIAYDRLRQNVFVVTAYWPDEIHFDPDLKTRKRK